LETARGGILLRGTAYESNDISVFVNISADHLDLQGIRTVEGLARTKSVVVRVTRADGVAVLNADDPLVMAASKDVRAKKWLVSQRPDNPELASHVAQGGTALVAGQHTIVVQHGDDQRDLIEIDRVPIAYGGKARHMVENALCAAAVGLAFGLSDEDVRVGLASFENSPEHNQGRLNVVSVGDVTVIIDYAHNESGLTHLLDFTRLHLQPGHRLIAIIGTAGDRTDHSLREIGRIAAMESDIVITKSTQRYLRGRSADSLLGLYEEGIRLAGKTVFGREPDELSAMVRALNEARPGDAICIMAQEQIPEILAYLSSPTGGS
jgi:cyanophycin synthetase